MGYWDSYANAATATDQMLSAPLRDQALQSEIETRNLANQQTRQAVSENARKLAVDAGAREAAASAQPVAPVSNTTTNGGYTPVPAVDTSSNVRALLGQADPAARAQLYDPAKTLGDNDLPPGVSTIPQSQYDAQTVATPLSFTPGSAFNPVADQVAAQTLKASQPTTTTTTTPGASANPLKAQIEYYNSIGETQKAQSLSDSLIDHANKVMALTGNPNDALKIVNDATGEKLAYSPLASLDAITNDGQLVGYIDKNKYKELVTSGAQPMEAMKGAMIPLDLGGGGKAVLEYMAAHPNATTDELAAMGAKAGVPLSKMVPLLNETVKAQAANDANTRTPFGQFQSEYLAAHKGDASGLSAAWDAKQAAIAHAGKADAAQIRIDTSNGNKPSNGGLTDDAVKGAAEMYNVTGVLPSGRNKEANAAIQNKAAELRKASGQSAVGVVANAGDMKALQETIKAQEKQVGSMGSFVKNIDKQVSRFEQISKDLSTADGRLLNVPLRALRGRVAGSPLQAKVDMYLTEISSETGKLASGATGSVAELSQGAREKWEKIHDPNLSMKDLVDVLKETRHAGAMRMDSVNEQLAETRKKREAIGTSGSSSPYPKTVAYIKTNLGKVSETAMIAEIRRSNPNMTDAEIHNAYLVAKGGR